MSRWLVLLAGFSGCGGGLQPVMTDTPVMTDVPVAMPPVDPATAPEPGVSPGPDTPPPVSEVATISCDPDAYTTPDPGSVGSDACVSDVITCGSEVFGTTVGGSTFFLSLIHI